MNEFLLDELALIIQIFLMDRPGHETVSSFPSGRACGLHRGPVVLFASYCIHWYKYWFELLMESHIDNELEFDQNLRVPKSQILSFH